jgi:hypothetical protein
VVTVLFLVAAPSEQRPSASLFDVSNFIHKSAIPTALNAQMCAPFRLLVQHAMTKKAKGAASAERRSDRALDYPDPWSKKAL